MAAYIYSYLIIIIIGFILSLNRQSHRLETRKLICISASIILLVIIGFRHPSMGVDLQYGKPGGYLGSFVAINNMSWSEVLTTKYQNYERGYIILNKLIGVISTKEQSLLIASCILSIFPIIYLVYKNSEYPLLSVIMYMGLPVFLLNFSGLRQAIAMGITALSFNFIKEKKPVQFILLVILASLFHKSAIVFLAMYPIYNIKLDKFGKVMSIVVLGIVYFARVNIFNLAMSILGYAIVPDMNGSIMLFIFYTMIYILAMLCETPGNKVEIGARNIFYVACLCQVFSDVYSIAGRLGFYYTIYVIIFIPSIIKNVSFFVKSDRFVAKYVCYLLVFGFFITYGIYQLSSRTSWAMPNPHHFYWTKDYLINLIKVLTI